MNGSNNNNTSILFNGNSSINDQMNISPVNYLKKNIGK